MDEPTNIQEAKTHLSRLLARVEAGEEIVLARIGTPIARIVPYGRTASRRHFGQDAGAFVVPDDFDAPLAPELLAGFTG